MINIVEDMLAKHSDAEIIEFLYSEMRVVDKYYDGVIAEGMDANLLLSQSAPISIITDVLKALHKRNQERQAQAGVVQ